MKTKEEIRDEVISIHPYKVPGRPETYDQYNQGWEDACYAMEEKMQDYADQETAELKKEFDRLNKAYSVINSSWEALAKENQQLKSEIAQLRSRLDDCKRKAITGQRI